MKTKRNNLLTYIGEGGKKSQSRARKRNETGPGSSSHIPAMISYNRHTHAHSVCVCMFGAAFGVAVQPVSALDNALRSQQVDTVITFLTAGRDRNGGRRSDSSSDAQVKHVQSNIFNIITRGIREYAIFLHFSHIVLHFSCCTFN